MNRLSQDALIRIVFVLIGFIVGVLDFFLNGQLLESLFKAFAVTAFLFIAELALEIRSHQKRGGEPISEFMRHNRNLTGSLLSVVHNDLQRAVSVQEDKFVVDHETLAILSYDTFWRLLVERMSAGHTLTVQTIHSCAIDVWIDHPLGVSLLNRQSEFCKRGGRISRILCDRSSFMKEPVKAAAEKMMDAGITVYYYNLLSHRIIDHNFAWDFARIGETNDVAIWDSFANNPGGVIGEAVYLNGSEYKGKNLMDLWERVAAASEPLRKGNGNPSSAPDL